MCHSFYIFLEQVLHSYNRERVNNTLFKFFTLSELKQLLLFIFHVFVLFYSRNKRYEEPLQKLNIIRYKLTSLLVDDLRINIFHVGIHDFKMIVYIRKSLFIFIITFDFLSFQYRNTIFMQNTPLKSIISQDQGQYTNPLL